MENNSETAYNLELDKSQIEEQTNANDTNHFNSLNNNSSKLGIGIFGYQSPTNQRQYQTGEQQAYDLVKRKIQIEQGQQFNSKNQNQFNQFQCQNGTLPSKNQQQVIEKLSAIFLQIKNDYFQQFCNDLTSWYIQSLKDQNRKIRDTKFIEIKKIEQQVWPFKDLYYKINKSQDEKIMLEFVNMCAEKIQATFRTYITRKRHLFALKKLKKFKENFCAVLKGWKTWNVFNCKKIKQIRNTIVAIQRQEQHQILHSTSQKHLKLKKIAYLKSNYQINVKLFKNVSNQLYTKGTWIFQVQKCFKAYKNTYHSSNRNWHEQQQNALQKVSSKGKQRQFPKQKVTNIQQQRSFSNQYSNKNEKVISNRQQIKVPNSFEIPLDQRPIRTKGQYNFDQQNILNSQNQFLKTKQNTQNRRKQIKESNNTQNQEALQNKAKIQQKKKLQKRHKYDPRKAIQQAKKRKQQQKLQEPGKDLNYLQRENAPQTKKPVQKKQQAKLQKSKSKSRQKTVEKVPKKQQKLNKKDDNSKSVKSISLTGTKSSNNVSSKIDCWGGQTSSNLVKKQQKLKIKSIVQKNQQNSYKSKYINQILRKKNQTTKTQKNQEFQQNANQYKLNYERMKQRVKDQNISTRQQHISTQNGQSIQSQKVQKYAKLIKQKNILQREEETQQPQSISQQRERFSNITQANSFKVRMEQQKQKVQVLSKKQKYQFLNHNMKQILRKKQHPLNLEPEKERRELQNQINNRSIQNQKSSQVVVRPIQQLQKVYETQYFERFGNLKPKLEMLSSTREAQLHQMIPVISQQGKFIKRIMKEHANMFWQQAKKLDTNFIEFIGRA